MKLTYEYSSKAIPINIFKNDGTIKTDYQRIQNITDMAALEGVIPIGAKSTGSSIPTNELGISWLKPDENTFNISDINTGDYVGVEFNASNFALKIKMADIRKLAIEQTELEKMARTDGSYAEFGLTFFGIVSKNAVDHKPVYIGGSYKEITYTEVVQTSESGNTPLGSYVGHSTTGDNINN